MNQIAIETRTPYIDIATGVDITSSQRRWAAESWSFFQAGPASRVSGNLTPLRLGVGQTREQQALDRLHSYGTGAANPSVVYLNGVAGSAALAELAAWL